MKKLLFILALFSVTSVFAVTISDLYQVEMSVIAQTDDLKEQAVTDGFLQMLIKISGDPQIADNPIIKDSLKRADYYVQEFSYLPSTTDSSQYFIHIRYDKSDVNRLLKKAGVAYWGENRPLILVWLVVTNAQHDMEIVGNETQGDVFNLMTEQSKKYGLPLIFPMMDVAEASQVSPDDITTEALPVLKEAAKRYAPGALLIGTIEESKDGLDSEWQLVLGDTRWNWTAAGKSMDNVLLSVMNQMSQVLAKRYAIKPTEAPEHWLQVQIMNVAKRQDLAELMRYLKQLTFVQQVRLLQVSGDVVNLSILIHGSLESFQQNVSIDQHLVMKSQDVLEDKMVYEWVH